MCTVAYALGSGWVFDVSVLGASVRALLLSFFFVVLFFRGFLVGNVIRMLSSSVRAVSFRRRRTPETISSGWTVIFDLRRIWRRRV